MENDELFADKIADLCHQYFEKVIPAKGKPQLGKEWTVLSAFVKENSLNSVIGAVDNVLNSLEVVAVGTGTKCLGQGEESADGDLVHDSHAEVVAKRSFVLYLVEELHCCMNQNKESIFELQNGKFSLKDNIKFHFYTSHPPCGDATIAPKIDAICAPENRSVSYPSSNSDHAVGEHQTTYEPTELLSDEMSTSRINDVAERPKSVAIKRRNSDAEEEMSKKRHKLVENDIYRTGAKSIEGLDSHAEGAAYHTVGAIRTKPGRGDPTLSLSCSDKMLKWNLVGLQGSLVCPLLVSPIRWSSVTVSGKQCDKSALQRALFLRAGPGALPVSIYHAEKAAFDFANSDDIALSSDKSVAHNCHGLNEVLNDGRRQGIVKMLWKTEKARSKICRLEIAKTVVLFVAKFEAQLNLPLNLRHLLKAADNLKFWELKNECKSDMSDKQNKVVSSFFPHSDVRNTRRKKLDSFYINETAKMKKNEKQKILLLCGTIGDAKNDERNDFVETLRRSSYDVRKVPVLKITFTNQEILQDKFERHLSQDAEHSRIDGLIFTSQNAVNSFARFKSEFISVKKKFDEKRFNEALHQIPTFVVGESTEKLVKKKLQLTCHGSKSGSAKNLSKFITENRQEIFDSFHEPKRILFPCGNLTDNQMSEILSPKQFYIDKVVCYKTDFRDSAELSRHLDSVTKVNSPFDFVVFFSPSGVQSAKHYFIKEEAPTKYIALGQKTGSEMEKVGLKVSCVCDLPIAQSLLEAILKVPDTL